MRFLKEAIAAALMLAAVSAGVFALDVQKNDDQKRPPREGSRVVTKERADPPQRGEDNRQRNDKDRGNDKDRNRGKERRPEGMSFNFRRFLSM